MYSNWLQDSRSVVKCFQCIELPLFYIFWKSIRSSFSTNILPHSSLSPQLNAWILCNILHKIRTKIMRQTPHVFASPDESRFSSTARFRKIWLPNKLCLAIDQIWTYLHLPRVAIREASAVGVTFRGPVVRKPANWNKNFQQHVLKFE